MRIFKVLSPFLVLFAMSFSGCKGCTQVGAQKPASFTVIPAAPGEIIEYGAVPGAGTLAAAMGNVLSQIHQACGEKPAVGQVFSVKGTSTAGVFFTVVDHAQANRQLAGLVIAAQTGANQFQAGVVSDSADRFAQTANPMMQQLFGAWSPGVSTATSGGTAAPAQGSGGSAPAGAAPASNGPLHTVTAPDNSASVTVPAGWSVDKSSFDGALILHGANGEMLALMRQKAGIDPTNAWQRRMAAARYQVYTPGSVLYAFRGDPAKEFAPLLQAWLQADGEASAQIQVQTSQAMPTAQGTYCASATGQLSPSGGSAIAFTSEVCATMPDPQYGVYKTTLTLILIPLSLGNQDQNLVKAIILSYKPNQQVITQENNQLLQAKQQADQRTLAVSNAIVNQIRQTGAQATARYNATEAANDAQHAGYWAQQNTNAQQSAGFSNYLLDQSVVSNGAGHATQWNSTANALVQSNPNKYQIVDTPNYWQGVDY